jgi:hypothetical protein
MTRGEYLDMGIVRKGRAGWLEHQQESSPRHGAFHAEGARRDAPDLPSALDEERLPGRALPPRAASGLFGARA